MNFKYGRRWFRHWNPFFKASQCLVQIIGNLSPGLIRCRFIKFTTRWKENTQWLFGVENFGLGCFAKQLKVGQSEHDFSQLTNILKCHAFKSNMLINNCWNQLFTSFEALESVEHFNHNRMITIWSIFFKYSSVKMLTKNLVVILWIEKELLLFDSCIKSYLGAFHGAFLLDITACGVGEMFEQILKVGQTSLAIGMYTKRGCDIWYTPKYVALSINLLDKRQNVFIEDLYEFLVLLRIQLLQVHILSDGYKKLVNKL